MIEKKYLIILIMALLFGTFSAQLTAQTRGDVNGDNSVNIVDALMTAQYSVGLNPANFNSANADVNCDSKITIVDALMIAQYYVGLISAFPCAATPTRTATPTITMTATSSASTIGSVSCAGSPIWNSNVVYNVTGELVQFNCKLYENRGYAFGLNPEENSYNDWTVWRLVGSCADACRMGEGPWVSCGLWEKWANNGYTVFNNIWGSGAGTQCIWAESYSNWGVKADHPATSGVKSYPNSSKEINVAIDSISSLTSSFNVTVPNSGAYSTTYDIWCDNNQYEIMVWMNKTGAVGPIARTWDDNGTPVPESTNTTVGGHTWDVYKGNIGFTVISFVRTTNTSSGTVDIKALLNYIKSQGWFANVVLGKVQFGFEITASAGGLNFTCNSYSCN